MKRCRQFFLLLAVFLLYSCQPEPDANRLIDELVVATNYDTAADFTVYGTYAIATDTIGLVSNATADTILVASESSFPRPVLNRIKSNLESRGYTQIPKDQDPDLAINVLVVNDYNVFQQVVYPGYYGYGGYPGSYYYSGYFGYSSYYYYPFISTYAYNTGTLVIEIVDLKNRTPDNQVRVVWDAYLGDVYSTLDLIDQTVKAIDQAFTQSPYLGK